MRIEFDPAKRALTLEVRGLDMARAAEVFEGPTWSTEDTRVDYGETRIMTAGLLDGRMVIMLWTPREDAHRVISLRKANGREQAAYHPRLRRRSQLRD